MVSCFGAATFSGVDTTCAIAGTTYPRVRRSGDDTDWESDKGDEGTVGQTSGVVVSLSFLLGFG